MGRSCAFVGSTAQRTTGETENFIVLMQHASSSVVIVPDLSRYWSMPTRPHVLPAGMSATCSWKRPIMMSVRWMLLMCRSLFLPGS